MTAAPATATAPNIRATPVSGFLSLEVSLLAVSPDVVSLLVTSLDVVSLLVLSLGVVSLVDVLLLELSSSGFVSGVLSGALELKWSVTFGTPKDSSVTS